MLAESGFGLRKAFEAGMIDPENIHLMAYALFAFTGNSGFMLTDEGIQKKFRKDYNSHSSSPTPE